MFDCQVGEAVGSTEAIEATLLLNTVAILKSRHVCRPTCSGWKKQVRTTLR